MLAPSAEMGPCRLTRVKFKPGRKLSAWYDLKLGDGPSPTRAVAVTWQVPDPSGTTPVSEPDGDDPAGALEQEIGERGLLAPFDHVSTSVAAIGMRLQVTPLDLAYPRLPALSDAVYVSQLLGQLDLGFGARIGAHKSRESSVVVRTIRFRPGQRHVLCYSPRSGHRHQAIYAKLRRGGQTTGPEVLVATAVADILAAHGDGLRALRPVADVGDDRVLLYRYVPGVPLTRLLARDPDGAGSSAIGQHLAQGGRIIRLLHDEGSAMPGTLSAPKPSQQLVATRRASEHIDRLLPGAGQAIGQLLARAGELLEGLPTEKSTFCHGDFKADHLLVGTKTITLIDFDSCVWADPALDLGKFLADLRYGFHCRNDPHIAAAQERFLAGYGMDEGSPLLARAKVYEAVLLVKLAARRVRVDHRYWPTRTAALVAHASDLLHAVRT